MKRKELAKRITAMLMIAVMTLTMSAFTVEDIFAATEEPAAQDVAAEEQSEYEAEPEDGELADEELTDEESGEAYSEEDVEPVAEEVTDEDAADDAEEAEPEVMDLEPEEAEGLDAEMAAPVDIVITVALNADGKMKLKWPAVSGADHYVVTKDAYNAYKKVKAGSEIAEETDSEGARIREFTTTKAEYTFTDLYLTRQYVFTVSAYSASDVLLGTSSKSVTEQPIVTPVKRTSRSSASISASKITFANGGKDLRTYIGEGHSGYAVAQGGCTDGKYAYYLMVSSSNQKGRVAVVDMETNELVKVSGVLKICHGNGMTYDSKRKQLVIVGRDEPENGVYRRQELTCVDADPSSKKFLKIIPERQRNIGYSYFADDTTNFKASERSKGVCALSYSPKYDVYVANQRINHNLIIIDPDSLQAIGIVQTTVIAAYPEVYQAMDGDDQYAYLLLSGYSRRNTNIVLALDWNSSKLVDSNGHRREYVPEKWNCINGNGNGSKSPVAVYTLKTKHEVENIYHTTDSSGKTHFYLTEYYANPQYKYVKVKKAYKVKWKKVKKKWKKVKKTKKVKVKVNGKTVVKKKTVYKWKYKKVWKYKTKYKYVKVKKLDYKERTDYVYDLGII